MNKDADTIEVFLMLVKLRRDPQLFVGDILIWISLCAWSISPISVNKNILEIGLEI